MTDRNNAIFAHEKPVPSAPGIETISQQEAVRRDFGLSQIPDEIAPLPSGGKTYPVHSPLHGQETLAFKGMTTKEENILTNKALIKRGTMITELLRSCILDKRIDPLDMLSGDRNALMVSIRASGYGAEYAAQVVCPACEKRVDYEFNLAELEVKRLTIDPVTPGSNEFQFTLPVSKKNVIFKFLSGRDEEEIQRISEALKKNKVTDPDGNVISTALFSCILSVDGVTDRAKLRQFSENMRAKDSLALRNYIRDNDPGLVMRQTMTCSACSESSEVPIPIGISFFWPSS